MHYNYKGTGSESARNTDEGNGKFHKGGFVFKYNATGDRRGAKSNTMPEHLDWKYDVKISNDNAKNEKRVTVHARNDETIEKAIEEAEKLYQGAQD